MLQSHIANRIAVVAEARGQLEGKHELIYKMDKLMPTFFAEMDIQPGSIHDQIIQCKLHDDAIAKLVGGILLAIVAIALTVVSLGAATPAVVAAGASIGAAGLSTYMAYDEYKQYTAEHATAEAGLADDPSVVWLVLAIVGAGVDMAAATKAVRALAPAARALHAGGELTGGRSRRRCPGHQGSTDHRVTRLQGVQVASVQARVDESRRQQGRRRSRADRRYILHQDRSGRSPHFVRGDKSIYNKLATEAGIDLDNMGGKTLPELKPGGFAVTLEQRTINVVPIAQ